MNTRKSLIGVVGGASLALAGCVSVTTTDYPKDWPKTEITITGKCPDISGTYSIFSDKPRVTESWLGIPVGPTSLASLIFFDRYEVRGEPPVEGTADVKQSDDRLSFHFRYQLPFRPDWKTEGKTFIYGTDYSCSPMGIHLKPIERTEAIGLWPIGGLSTSKNKLQFLKTVDGSLVANLMSSEVGVSILLVPIPVYGSSNTWWRWNGVSGDETKSQR